MDNINVIFSFGPFLLPLGKCIRGDTYREGDYLKLKKVLNNNVIIAEDEAKQEFVVIGLGIAFQLQRGEVVPEAKIERIFSSMQEKNQLQQMVESISSKYFDLAVEIIEFVEASLQVKLSDTIYITLTDHIAFIHERLQKGHLPKNSLRWEIKQYYAKEFQLACKIVELLEEEFGQSLNEDEAASIALHIVNAELDNKDLHGSMEAIHLMDQIMQILRYQMQMNVKEDDLNYQRLITHVKFFVQRVLANHQLQEANPLYQMVKANYPDAYSIAERIRIFVEKKVEHAISDDEITYLIIHIARLMVRK